MRIYPRVVVALSASALNERGWPTLAEDPAAAAARASRSIAYLADHHSVIVTHCLDEHTSGLLQRGIERELGEPVMSTAAPDADAIARLATQRFVVLCATGTRESCHEDVAGELAVAADADVLLLLIGEPVVWDANHSGDEPRAVRTTSLDALASLRPVEVVAPAMGAASRFVQATGRMAAIGAIDHAEAMVAGVGGTQIRDDGAPTRFYGEQSPDDG